MNTSDFDYDLPHELIAQHPIEPRDASRLMVVHRRDETIHHTVFREIGEYLQSGDVLVLNETRVIPARLAVRKVPSGGRAELLLLRPVNGSAWEALAGGKGLKKGRLLQVENGPSAEIIAELGGARRLVRFEQPVEEFLYGIGQVPLPPYIHESLADPDRYQTVFARRPGSAAAPTAGLHFTPELIASLQDQGIRFAYLTLHVGLDTFAPVSEHDPRDHLMHTEWCCVDGQAAALIEQARRDGGRVIAVGTTSVRTLETACRSGEERAVSPYEGPTDLFILPGYQFHAVDALVTNFHLPRSTLIMMVSAFAGRELILRAYELAKQEGYRFYSFGDAMLIL